MATRSIHQPVIDYLQDNGAEVFDVTQEGKHPKIHFTYKGIEKFLVVSLTPSDRRTFENQKKSVRHLLAEIDLFKPNIRDEEVIVDQRHRRLPALDTIGRRLQYAREQQQLSRTRLSEIAQVPIDIIESVETTSHAQLNWLAALKLSTALRLSLSYLTGVLKEGEQTMSSLAERVRDQRTKQNLTVGMLANKTGIPVQQLTNLETGDLENFYRLDEVAAALDCTPEYLRTGKVEEEHEFTGSVKSREELGAMFRFYRDRAGLSQKQMVNKFKLNHQAEFSRFERTGGYNGQIISNLDRIAELLEIPNEIIKGIPPEFLQPKKSGGAPYTKNPKQPVETAPPTVEPVREVERVAAVLPPPPDIFGVLAAIREEGRQTRELLQSQHEALVAVLKALPAGAGIATTLHTLIDNLFTSKE